MIIQMKDSNMVGILASRKNNIPDNALYLEYL